jgi:hypothetical protein
MFNAIEHGKENLCIENPWSSCSKFIKYFTLDSIKNFTFQNDFSKIPNPYGNNGRNIHTEKIGLL